MFCYHRLLVGLLKLASILFCYHLLSFCWNHRSLLLHGFVGTSSLFFASRRGQMLQPMIFFAGSRPSEGCNGAKVRSRRPVRCYNHSSKSYNRPSESCMGASIFFASNQRESIGPAELVTGVSGAAAGIVVSACFANGGVIRWIQGRCAELEGGQRPCLQGSRRASVLGAWGGLEPFFARAATRWTSQRCFKVGRRASMANRLRSLLVSPHPTPRRAR